MHGTIEVESEIEQGATFTVRLPLERIQKLKANEEDTKSTVETETKKSNVLLVEDNYEVLKLLQSIFKEDYKVSTAMNGKDALKSINKSMPDLIISDVMMPLMSGIELCNTLKKDSKFSHIPIILLSAKSQLYDKLEGLESGADAYLTKPFSLEEIKKTVSNLILQRKTIIDKFSKTIAAFSDENMVSHEILILQKASEFILENIENEDLSVNDLANHLNMSRFTLIRRFKSINNMTPNVYIQKIRLEKAKEMIKNKVASMSEIAFKVGFASSTYFTSSFKKEFGITPKDFLHLSDSEQGGTL
jgi:YesN/AraC family two-component response regulator